MPEQAQPAIRDPLSPPPPRTPDPLPYAELEVTSNFSFLRGASHPDELVYRAAELGHRAIALTDRNSLAGIVRAHVAAKKAGLKLLVGARLTFDDAPDVLVWAADRSGYGRLCRLLTLGKRRAAKGDCALLLRDLLEHEGGLLAAVGGEPTDARLARTLDLLRAALGDRLSLATRMRYDGEDAARLEAMEALSRRCDTPLLATNDVHYHDPSRRPLQDVLGCVRDATTIDRAGWRLLPNAERHLKPPAAMHRLFASCPRALRRALQIVDRCGFRLDELRYEYPREVAPPPRTPLQHLVALAWQGAADRYPDGLPSKVRAQIEHELALIEALGYEAYFLTVHDLVRFARARGILCQGRGSAANSAVCYCLGVTSVDPARIDLLFERFVSAARNEPPDIDIDFEHERREEVLQYLYDKYGRDRAGMTAEVITYRGRSAVRDVGKAMGLSLDMVDGMARKLDWWDRGRLTPQRLREAGLDGEDPTVRRVVDLVGPLLGFPRHLSQHVGGMVMTRGPLCELAPIENASMPGRTVIEWDKDDIEALGILKVDCLGLGMLTCVSKALEMLGSRRRDAEARGREGDEESGEQRRAARKDESTAPRGADGSVAARLELHSIPPEDPAVYDMICRADTIGVFQIESRAQMSMLPRLRPRCFYDLVIEVAIVRPGPIQGNMVHPYLRRRNGQEPVSYPSEALRDVLHKTLGVPLFQEQAMRVAMVGAGFTAEQADELRRAMAAWRRSDAILSFRERIVQGMIGNGYTEAFAHQCFEQIKGFGEYGFPESHSASFALLVYVSAWLKRHHPAAFAAALINSQPMGFYAPAQIIRDAREHGVEVRPADVNASGWDCALEERDDADDGPGEDWRAWGRGGPAIRLGLRMIRGLRRDEADRIVDARRRQGRFASLEHLRQSAALSGGALRRLAEADAFTSLGLSRRPALWQAMGAGTAPKRRRVVVRPAPRPGEATLFDRTAIDDEPPPPPLPPMPQGQEVLADYAAVGLSLRRHPVSLIRERLERLRVEPADRATARPHGSFVRVAGVVLIRQRPGTASGIVFITLEDETGIANLIVRPRVFDRDRLAGRHAALIQADGWIERQGDVVHIMVRRLHDRDALLAGYQFVSRDFH